jgi:hypothetical protein
VQLFFEALGDGGNQGERQAESHSCRFLNTGKNSECFYTLKRRNVLR